MKPFKDQNNPKHAYIIVFVKFHVKFDWLTLKHLDMRYDFIDMVKE